MADSYNFLSLYTMLYIILSAAGHIMIKQRKKQSKRLVTGSKKPDVVLERMPSGEVRRERGSSETVRPTPPSSENKRPKSPDKPAATEKMNAGYRHLTATNGSIVLRRLTVTQRRSSWRCYFPLLHV